MASRDLVVRFIGDDKDLQRAFTRSERSSKNFGRGLERAGRGAVVAQVGFRGLGRSVAFASGAFLGGAGFVAAVKSSVAAASNLEEQQNKTNVVFGRSANVINDFAKNASDSFGLSTRAALEAAGAYGGMFTTLGLGQQEMAQMSVRLIKLAADMASFSNEDPTDMLDRLRSGLAGEAEPLRRFGVLLSEARVKQEAYRTGLAAAGEELTEQQKVLARYQLILRDAGVANGDFGRTSESLANLQRRLRANVENLQARLGTALLPTIIQITSAINSWVGEEENQVRLQQAVTRGLELGTTAAQAFHDVFKALAPVAQGVSDTLGGMQRTVRLLVAAFVASKIVSFTGALTGLSTQALVATGRVKALRTALLRLGAIGVVAIAIELILEREAINKLGAQVEDKVPFLFSGQNAIPFEVTVENLPQLEKLRSQVAKVKGEGDLLVRTLDTLIAKLRQVDGSKATATVETVFIGGERFRPMPGLSVGVEEERERANADAIIRRITRQATIQKSLNRQLAESERRASHLADLIREDPTNLKLQQRYADELRKQVGLRQDIAQSARDQAQADRDAAQAAKDAADARARERAEARKAALEAQRNARRSRQFVALGLTSEGQERIPGVGALRRRLGTLREQIAGTPLDTKKTRSQLANIAKVLSGAFGEVGRDVRSAILEMFRTIFGALDEGEKQGPLTASSGLNTKKILAGMGLDPDEIRELRGRLSSINSAGRQLSGSSFAGPRRGGPDFGRPLFESGRIVVESHTTINLDGQRIANVVTRNQQKKRRRNPGQKRGPNRVTGGV